MQDINWIKLPEIKEARPPVYLLYGADEIIAQYTNSLLVPTGIAGEWVHGVTFPWHYHSPSALIVGNASEKQSPNWVVSHADEKYLIEHGFKAKAIGLPICYLPLDGRYARRPNSLLIMPAHSSFYVNAYTQGEKTPANEYIEYLHPIIAEFDTNVACLHYECIKRGLWVKEFKELGVNSIQGASTHDLNSLERIRALMSQFEYVTSNVIGSHIAYAAAFGAKVSISGPYQKWNRSEYLKEPIYRDNPSLLDYLEKEEDMARTNFPFLFVAPKDSQRHIDWGNEMIGTDNKVLPNELIRLFKTDLANEFLRRSTRNARSVIKKSLNLLGLYKQKSF